MQNEDEELRGLEKKLGRLVPKDMDESCRKELLASLDREHSVLSERQDDGTYPPNVLWMRFAPVAAAVGVVLLGTFFLRYESRMEVLQSKRSDTAPTAANDVGSAMASVDTPANSQLMPLPVPRLGVGEKYGINVPYSADSGLLPVSAQNYLQPLDETLGELYRQGNANLHFEDAYDWQEGLDGRKEPSRDPQTK